MPRGAKPKPIPERFWPKVQKSSDPNACWLWVGARDDDGYGVALRNKIAHRVSWQLNRGPIPDGLFVLHRCDNPPCVRPEHLYLGTHSTNMADRRRKGRAAFGERNANHLYPERRPRGERNGAHKLTLAQVAEIRSAAKIGTPRKDLAQRFGVAVSTVESIIAGRSWRDPAEKGPA